ncbi:hypothetical protein [Mycolicibacterium goodii]|nr:hypothetical protein [Mycolicibacterium goodii]
MVRGMVSQPRPGADGTIAVGATLYDEGADGTAVTAASYLSRRFI